MNNDIIFCIVVLVIISPIIFIFIFFLIGYFRSIIFEYVYQTVWYRQYREYKDEKQRIKDLAKKRRYERKLEKYRSRLHLDEPESELSEEYAPLEGNFQTQREEQFNEFLKFAHQQMEKFSLYTSNDRTLQRLLDETFLSISRLTARLTPDNYMESSQIFDFYKVGLEHYFTLLNSNSTHITDKKFYASLKKCLVSIRDKADKLAKGIKESKTLKINVQLDALIEYIES